MPFNHFPCGVVLQELGYCVILGATHQVAEERR